VDKLPEDVAGLVDDLVYWLGDSAKILGRNGSTDHADKVREAASTIRAWRRPMESDVAALVVRLEADLAIGCAAPARDIKAAASTIRALVAEIERLRAYHLRAEEVGQRQALRAHAAEAKLREAVEVMKDIATSDTIDNCLDPQRNKRVARAFLATMEKPHDP